MQKQRLQASEGEDAMMAAIFCGVEKEKGEEKSDEKNVNVERMRIGLRTQQAVEKVQSKLTDLEAVYDSVKADVQKIVEGADGADKGAMEKVAADLEHSWGLAKAHLLCLSKEVTACQSGLPDASTVPALVAIHEAAATKMKTMCQGATTDFQALVKQIRNQSRAQVRAFGILNAKQRKTEEEATRQKPALWHILVKEWKSPTNGSDSLFECLQGVRAARVSVSSENSYQKIIDDTKTRACIRTNLKNLKLGQAGVVTAVSGGPGPQKKFKTLVRSGCDIELFTAVVLPKTDWAFHVFKFEVVTSSSAWASISWPHLGMMEARLVMAGSMVVAGVENNSVPGHSFKDKRDYLAQTTGPGLWALIQANGFVEKFQDGQMEGGANILVIPSGFATVTAAENCTYLRWSFCGDERDAARANLTLQGLCDSFADLKTGTVPYADYAKYIGCRV